MSAELPLHVVVTILECCVTFSGVKLSIRSFVLFMKGGSHQRTEEEIEFVFEHLGWSYSPIKLD